MKKRESSNEYTDVGKNMVSFNEETYNFHLKSKGFLRKIHFVKVIWSKIDNLIWKFSPSALTKVGAFRWH